MVLGENNQSKGNGGYHNGGYQWNDMLLCKKEMKLKKRYNTSVFLETIRNLCSISSVSTIGKVCEGTLQVRTKR